MARDDPGPRRLLSLMRIAVTGANGFVGRAVLARLGAGVEAVPLVRRATGLPGEIVVGDLGQEEIDPRMLAGVDAVIHLAARTHVMHETVSDPEAEYWRTNVAGTSALLDAALAAGVSRFVFMSSVKAVAERSQPGAPVGPDGQPRPEDAYGRTKLAAEELVRRRCDEASVGWVILRPPLVYGPGVRANLERLVRLVGRGLPLPFGAINNRRSMVEVRNLADAAIIAARHPDATGQAFMVSDTTLSTPDLVRAIADALGKPARLVPVPAGAMRFVGRIAGRSDMIERLCGSLELDSRRTGDILGWEPAVAFGDSLAEIVAVMKSGGPKRPGSEA